MSGLRIIRYWLTAQWIRGMDADTIKQILTQQSADELGHAEKLANRIIQLGGPPSCNLIS